MKPMFKLFKKADPPEVAITVSYETLFKVIVAGIAAVLFFAVLKQALHALTLIFTAFFLALALNAPVQWIARHLPGRLKGKRAAATAFSFLLVIALLGAFIASIVPPLIKQTESFVNAAPTLVDDARSGNGAIGHLIRQYHLEGQVDTFSSQLGDRLKGVGGTAVSSLGKVGSSVFSVLTILVLTFMMLIEGPRIMGFFRELIPGHRRRNVERLSGEMYGVIKGYINGQVTLAALAAALISPVLFILHVPYALALVVVIFICGLIPLVGHTIGAIIVTLVALSVSPVAALIVLGYYILYQQIENYLIQPRIQANSTNMSPLLVFMSVVIGVSFGGLAGGLFAIPVAGCIRIVVLDYLKNHEYIADKPIVEDEVTKAGTK
jgi:predicted PurR-regulated permease PerM